MQELSLQTAETKIMAADEMAEAVAAREYAIACIKWARELKEKADDYIINLSESEGTNKFMVTEEKMVVIGKKKTTKFDTEMVYDLLNCSQVMRDVLPKNPTFRKTALLTLIGDDEETKAECIKESFDDTIVVKDINTKYLK